MSEDWEDNAIGEWAQVPLDVGPSKGVNYKRGTVSSFFFEYGPGYWRTKWTYLAAWVGGFCLLPFCGAGIFVWAFLLVRALNNRQDWRTQELIRAIRQPGRLDD